MLDSSNVLDSEEWEWTKDEKETDTTYAAMPGSRRIEYIRFFQKDSTLISYLSSLEFDFKRANEIINKTKNNKTKREGDVYKYFLRDNLVTFLCGVSFHYLNYVGTIKKNSITFNISYMDKNKLT